MPARKKHEKLIDKSLKAMLRAIKYRLDHALFLQKVESDLPLRADRLQKRDAPRCARFK